jgi:GDPmannose 4,6-dehydratase
LEIPQTEKTSFAPENPYGTAKVHAHWTTVNFREAFILFACYGIMFNHESPRRGENFVSLKIALSLANILAGKQYKIILGNLDARRDLGYAKDYVEGMWRTPQQPKPDDYIFATGQQYSVRDFILEASSLCSFDIEWQGSGVDEVGNDKNSNHNLIEVNPSFFRPTEVDTLVGDPKKALNILNWRAKTTFKELVHLMVESDLKKSGLDPNNIIKQ